MQNSMHKGTREFWGISISQIRDYTIHLDFYFGIVKGESKKYAVLTFWTVQDLRL